MRTVENEQIVRVAGRDGGPEPAGQRFVRCGRHAVVHDQHVHARVPHVLLPHPQRDHLADAVDVVVGQRVRARPAGARALVQDVPQRHVIAVPLAPGGRRLDHLEHGQQPVHGVGVQHRGGRVDAVRVGQRRHGAAPESRGGAVETVERPAHVVDHPVVHVLHHPLVDRVQPGVRERVRARRRYPPGGRRPLRPVAHVTAVGVRAVVPARRVPVRALGATGRRLRGGDRDVRTRRRPPRGVALGDVIAVVAPPRPVRPGRRVIGSVRHAFRRFRPGHRGGAAVVLNAGQVNSAGQVPEYRHVVHRDVRVHHEAHRVVQERRHGRQRVPETVGRRRLDGQRRAEDQQQTSRRPFHVDVNGGGVRSAHCFSCWPLGRECVHSERNFRYMTAP